jgi:hypothetical protein
VVVGRERVVGLENVWWRLENEWWWVENEWYGSRTCGGGLRTSGGGLRTRGKARERVVEARERVVVGRERVVGLENVWWWVKSVGDESEWVVACATSPRSCNWWLASPIEEIKTDLS